MDYTEKLIEILKNKIASRVYKLEGEIISLKIRQREDESLYGFGRFYMKKEHAVNKRENEIEKLKQFEKQLRYPVLTNKMIYSVLYCKNCHFETLTKGPITGEWHECPVCKKMIYGNSGKKLIIYTLEKYLSK